MDKLWQRIYDKSMKTILQSYGAKSVWDMYEQCNDLLEAITSATEIEELVHIISVLESYCSRWDEQTKQRSLKTNYHKDFAKIRWLKPPGEYSDEPAGYYKNKEAWLPTSWLKVLK